MYRKLFSQSLISFDIDPSSIKASLLAQMSHDYECSVILLLKRLRRLITEYAVRGIVLYLVHREHVDATYTCIYPLINMLICRTA